MNTRYTPSFQLHSPAFPHNGEIPEKYTCEGEDISPPLLWTGFPQSTRSFALIVEDPDAPDPRGGRRPFVHWVLFNIPPTVISLDEGLDTLPERARAGTNDFGRAVFGGACPPAGKHRYLHRLYALDDYLALPGGARREEVEEAMTGHILGVAELIGYYEKTRAA